MAYSRRDFFKTSTLGGAAMITGSHIKAAGLDNKKTALSPTEVSPLLPSPLALDLSPAKWIWYPSQRTLANTFILFRRTIKVKKQLRAAKGWILGDSRYLLEVDQQRIQWGPPPADPRYSEADPIDLTNILTPGEHVLATTVLYYGMGDGTWPMGKPGFLFKLTLEYESGETELILSDENWHCHLARSWQPGQYKRWYLRALQEEFDANLYPYGWNQVAYAPNNDWLNAQELKGKANQPSLSTNSADYLYNSSAGATSTTLRKRSIPLIKEEDKWEVELVSTHEIKWHRPVQEYFEMVTPNAFEGVAGAAAKEIQAGVWEMDRQDTARGTVLTFRFPEQMVGWPFFTIDAPKGTTIELLVHEAHIPFGEGGAAIMNSHFHSWSRFICKEGANSFMPFDYESVKWLQLHIHATKGKVQIKKVGLKRRLYDWPNPPKISVSDLQLQQLIDASINTIYNNAHDTIVDGVGRERQQYSGDIGHELHALYRVFGETRLPARYLNTYSQGMTLEGFFLDTWPAYDRLNRLAQRQLGLTPWGPLLDHGIGFNFDCYHHYLYTQDRAALEEVFPRLVRFFAYLQSIVGTDGLLPVENIGVPTVWMDTDAYQQQGHKQCAFNLYAIAMLQTAFAPICMAFDQQKLAKSAIDFAQQLWQKNIHQFWDREQETFVVNKPWLAEEEEPRYCDRSLSTALLFDLCPQQKRAKSRAILVEQPPNLGRSYPANANWQLWALADQGLIDQVFKDFGSRWINMASVVSNNSMQEAWKAAPDSGAQWSHAAIAPLFVTYQYIAGIQPLSPGFTRVQIRPQLGHLTQLSLINYTVQGPIHFSMTGQKGNRQLQLELPSNCQGELLVDQAENLDLPSLSSDIEGLRKYELAGGQVITLKLQYT